MPNMHKSELDYIQPVSAEEQAFAMDVLRKKLGAGEDPKKILRVDDKYYCDKILNGLITIDSLIYKRITHRDSKNITSAHLGLCEECGAQVACGKIYCNGCLNRKREGK